MIHPLPAGPTVLPESASVQSIQSGPNSVCVSTLLPDLPTQLAPSGSGSPGVSKRKSLAPSESYSTPGTSLSRMRLSMASLRRSQSTTDSAAKGGKQRNSKAASFQLLLESVQKDEHFDPDALDTFLAKIDPKECVPAPPSAIRATFRTLAAIFRDDVAYQYSSPSGPISGTLGGQVSGGIGGAVPTPASNGIGNGVVVPGSDVSLSPTTTTQSSQSSLPPGVHNNTPQHNGTLQQQRQAQAAQPLGASGPTTGGMNDSGPLPPLPSFGGLDVLLNKTGLSGALKAATLERQPGTSTGGRSHSMSGPPSSSGTSSRAPFPSSPLANGAMNTLDGRRQSSNSGPSLDTIEDSEHASSLPLERLGSIAASVPLPGSPNAVPTSLPPPLSGVVPPVSPRVLHGTPAGSRLMGRQPSIPSPHSTNYRGTTQSRGGSGYGAAALGLVPPISTGSSGGTFPPTSSVIAATLAMQNGGGPTPPPPSTPLPGTLNTGARGTSFANRDTPSVSRISVRACTECNMVCGPSIPALGFLQQAVLAHEQGKLELSLHFLKHARESDPVLPLPVFLEGIYLRHGWGCRPDHPESYRCLHIALMLSIDALKATIKFGMGANAPPGLPTVTLSRPATNPPAGTVTPSIQGSVALPPPKTPAEASKYRQPNAPTPKPPPYEPSGARSMVGLVLYEMSASHRFGWGVRKDRGLANQLMELAANLGDVDACVDVGTRSLKHNEKRKAARYLRWASFGGWKDFGTGWIWKEKYD